MAQEHRAGTVALVGWTNVGKSTLLNRLVGVKLAAVADASQTTRRRLLAVTHLPGRAQIAFVDTPGWHKPRYRMNRRMMEIARQSLRDVDVVLWVADAARGLGPGDREVVEAMRGGAAARIAVLNKIDLVGKKSRLLPMIAEIDGFGAFAEIVPVSAATGDGCEPLLDAVCRQLPVGPPLFDDDFLTDQTQRQLVAEQIREQIVRFTREELPHSTAVQIDAWEEPPDGGTLRIEASVLVERDSQKKIVIGREGSLLKQIGSAARAEIERHLDRPIYLGLWVRTRRDWRNDTGILRELELD